DVVDEVAAAIRATGGEACGVAAHMGEPDQIQSLIEATLTRYGSIDILVNNAAINPTFGYVIDSEMSVLQKMLDVNLKGYLLAIQKCVPSMRQRGGGSVINLASTAGLSPAMGLGLYSITKAAVI